MKLVAVYAVVEVIELPTVPETVCVDGDNDGVAAAETVIEIVAVALPAPEPVPVIV